MRTEYKKAPAIRLYQWGFGCCFLVISRYEVFDSSETLGDDFGMIRFHMRYLRTKIILRQLVSASGTRDRPGFCCSGIFHSGVRCRLACVHLCILQKESSTVVRQSFLCFSERIRMGKFSCYHESRLESFFGPVPSEETT